MRKLGVNGFTIKDHGGPGLTVPETAVILYELSKIDVSLATFMGVQNSLGLSTVDFLGNEEQRKRFLPDGIALNTIWSFGLTEPDYGSDAASLKTTATKTEGGYLINGKKRWIGNGTICDYVVTFARYEGEVKCFVVARESKGLTTSKIENKYGLRLV